MHELDDELWRGLFANRPVHTLVLDLDGRVLAASRRFSRILGCEEPPQGRILWELPLLQGIPGLADRVAAYVRLAVSIGSMLESLPVHLELGPQDVWVGAIYPIHDQQGVIHSLYAEMANTIFHPVEPRTRAHHAAAFLDHAFVVAPAPMVVIDATCKIHDANPAWFAMVGEAAAIAALRLGAIASAPADERATLSVGFERVATGEYPWLDSIWIPGFASGIGSTATIRWTRLDDGTVAHDPWLLGIARELVAARDLDGLRAEANRDHLTGLANRRAFDASLAEAVARIGVDHEGIALFMMDVDGLKAANDVFGHAAGDALLVAVAARLADCCVAGMVARIGGDEFAGWKSVVAPDADPGGQIAAIHAAVERPIAEAPHLGTPRISIGAAMITAPDADLAAAFDAADRAMYAAKAARRHGPDGQAAG